MHYERLLVFIQISLIMIKLKHKWHFFNSSCTQLPLKKNDGFLLVYLELEIIKLLKNSLFGHNQQCNEN